MKSEFKRYYYVKEWVAPLVGAWIEILLTERTVKYHIVAPLVGAWIEIPIAACICMAGYVAPLVGAWIEISTLKR